MAAGKHAVLDGSSEPLRREVSSCPGDSVPHPGRPQADEPCRPDLGRTTPLACTRRTRWRLCAVPCYAAARHTQTCLGLPWPNGSRDRLPNRSMSSSPPAATNNGSSCGKMLRTTTETTHGSTPPEADTYQVP